MARRVLADFDTELLLRVGNRTDITAAIRAHAIQDAARNIANIVPDPALERTVVLTLGNGSSTLDPIVAPNATTDVWWPMFLRNETDEYLLGPGDKVQIEGGTKPSGPPHKYYWFNSKFEFDSTASASTSIKLWYKRKPVEFTASPETDELYDPLILTKAAELCFLTVRDFDEVNKQRGILNDQKRELRIPASEAKLDHTQTGIRVRMS